MSYEDGEIRRQARERLEARKERNRRSGSQPSSRTGRPAAAASSSATRPLWPVAVVAVAAIAVIVLLLMFAVPTCSGGAQNQDRDAGSSGAPAAANGTSGVSSDADGGAVADGDPYADDDAEPDAAVLSEIIGQEETDKLVSQAQSSDDARWIAAHPDAYAFDGPEVQAKVLKLAADEPLALSYVRNFPARYAPIVEGASDDAQAAPTGSDEQVALPTDSPSADVPGTNVPHLYQWDSRWGYTVYNGDAFGLSGCGPTSLAMVYQALTGKTDLTPYDMGQLAYEGDYVVEWKGTASEFFADAAEGLGLKCEVLDPSADAIVQALKGGKPIVANLGEGTFTSYGHFFVLAGVADNGQIIVNDPYSATRSSRTWDPEVIASESLSLFAYSK